MDKQRAAAIEAVAARDEQIKTHSVEYLWVCHGVKPPLLPNTPVVTESNVDRSATAAAPARSHREYKHGN